MQVYISLQPSVHQQNHTIIVATKMEYGPQHTCITGWTKEQTRPPIFPLFFNWGGAGVNPSYYSHHDSCGKMWAKMWQNSADTAILQIHYILRGSFRQTWRILKLGPKNCTMNFYSKKCAVCIRLWNKSWNNGRSPEMEVLLVFAWFLVFWLVNESSFVM